MAVKRRAANSIGLAIVFGVVALVAIGILIWQLGQGSVLAEKIAFLDKNNQALQAENQRLKTQMEKMTLDQASWQVEQAKVLKELEQVKAENEALRGGVNSLVSQQKTLERENTDLKLEQAQSANPYLPLQFMAFLTFGTGLGILGGAGLLYVAVRRLVVNMPSINVVTGALFGHQREPRYYLENYSRTNAAGEVIKVTPQEREHIIDMRRRR